MPYIQLGVAERFHVVWSIPFPVCLLHHQRAPQGTQCRSHRLTSPGPAPCRFEKKEAELLQTLNDLEIETEEDKSTLFRGASLTTALLDLYMKSVCTGFLHVAISDMINKIVESKQACEVRAGTGDMGCGR